MAILHGSDEHERRVPVILGVVVGRRTAAWQERQDGVAVRDW
jgi:hypothetical protein